MIVQRFNLNLIPNQSPVVVHVNQYDTGTGRLIATLYEGNEPYSPNGTAVIQGTKPDGHGFQYTATLDGNVVTADLTEQMAPVAGDVRTQIVVTESSGVTGTFAFIIRVQPSALPSDTDMSESDYQYIEEAIREAQEAVETAQEATETAQEAVERAQEAIAETHENAENSEAWAQGTRGGIPVGPTDPTYEHNAEYWAQYAERYAQGGLHYKGSIPFADIPTTGMREGDMYDITDDFTTDSRFTEGAGIEVKGGTNIAWNSDNKWDILALPYIPKTTFNGRSGSILPMAGDYDSKKILLSSALHIGGETQNDVQEALEALSDDGVKSFNGRSGSVLPMAGDYDSEKILLASVLHIGGETQDNVQKALEALEGNKADKVDNAIADNFAGLDANGNLKDSGKNAGDFATPSDIAGQQSLLKDTVGWTGKNLLELTLATITKNGITATVNNGVVSTSGTSEQEWVSFVFNPTVSLKAGRYILSGISDGSPNTYRFTVAGDVVEDFLLYGGEQEFTITADGTISVTLYIRRADVDMSGKVFYPMLRKADITDPTYEPYHESVEVMYEEEIHGVNLLKNIGPSKTINGVTFTVNADGSVTANGTATAQCWFSVKDYLLNPLHLDAGSYFVNGCSGGSSSTHSIRVTNGASALATSYNGETAFNLSSSSDSIGVYIVIGSNQTVSNLVFKPMIRLATIEDNTYRPYNPQAIQNQLNAQGVLGAKNLLKIPDNVVTRTISGVTFTVNRNSKGEVISIVANGTATATVDFAICDRNNSSNPNVYDNGKYIGNGCPSGGSTSTYLMYFDTNNSDGTLNRLVTDVGNGGEFTITDNQSSNYPSNRIQVLIRIANGQTVSNLTFKPMIRLASDPDDTYQPYAMTNRELTDFVTPTVLSGVDLNNITTPGWYSLNGSITNNAGFNTGYLLVQKHFTGAIKQIAMPQGELNSAERVYIRSKQFSNFTPWYMFAGTVVS